MPSINKAVIMGTLGRDPEIRSTNNGDKIANLSVATSERWKDKQSGEWKEKTEWHRVSIMNDRLAEVAERDLRKGSRVYLEGQIQTRKWTDNSGQEKFSTEIMIGKFKGELLCLDGKKDNQPQQQSRGGGYSREEPDLDDSIPF